jgi:hypothetical protein
MIKDRFFYPLAACFVAVIVGFALSFGENVELSEREIWTNGYVMAGEDLSRLTAQPGTQAIFVASSNGQPAYARLSSTAARASLPSDKPGVFAPIGPQYEAAFAGRDLRLTITARASAINGLKVFDMGYFTDGSGDSAWLRKPLGANWSEYVMTFRPRELTDRRGLDYFSIWPGETAEVLNMDVKEMRIEVLNPPT